MFILATVTANEASTQIIYCKCKLKMLCYKTKKLQILSLNTAVASAILSIL